MATPADPVTEDDLGAYVDDQIDLQRRVEVEDHLARHPDAAARVMADLRTRDELRLALPLPAVRAPMRTAEAARRLERALGRDAALRTVRRLAALAALIAVGWFAHAELGALGISRSEASAPPPAFVAEAAMSHRTALLRATMPSQPGAPDYDPDVIRRATGIVVPSLPEGWRPLDVQVFPAQEGPSVEAAAAAARLGTVSLFAVRTGTFDVRPPALVRDGAETVAYWQVGEAGYALVGAASAEDLGRAARTLFDRLH